MILLNMGKQFGNCAERYYIYKWICPADQLSAERKLKKTRKKSEKKRMIAMYGYEYYLRDRTWQSIKNQKRRETFDQWRYRLALYNFTIDGFDTKYNQQHYAKPLVHEYRFGPETNSDSIGEKKEMTHIWNEILNSFSKKPRDVLTFGKRKYFYVYTEGTDVYLESGREHKNASEIKGRRQLDKNNLQVVYEQYKLGSKPSEVADVTYNSVYWMGIFRDLDL